MRSAAILAIATFLGGCSEQPATTIDGSSPDAFAQSIDAARRDLPVADRLQFDRAIATVPARRYGNRHPEAAARSAFDGMTAADVVAVERERTGGRIE